MMERYNCTDHMVCIIWYIIDNLIMFYLSNYLDYQLNPHC
jgi:hypothetical protein